MQFKIHKNQQLPPLSWLAHINKGSDDINLICGDAVEVCDGSFSAGVWNSEFSDNNRGGGKTLKNKLLCGTAGTIAEKCAIFFGPSHPQESLYSHKTENAVIVSNSIPFILAYTDNNLREDYFDYDRDLNSAFYGYKDGPEEISLLNGGLRRHLLKDVTVSEKLDIKETRKSRSNLEINSYDDYINALTRTLQEFSKNANSPKRKHKYKFITTLSRGYDGCATSALARKVGCDTALTFTTPGKYVADSGVEIANQLGFKNIIEGNGEAYKTNSELWEAEAASIGDVGSIVPLNEFEKETAGNILLLGIRGDHIWDKNGHNTNRDFNFSLPEFCMGINPEQAFRNNTITISVPFLLAENWPEIEKISNSKEMESWSLGNDYDRPIPRRILEEMGVPRENFGHRKTGVGFSFRLEPCMGRIKKKMSENSYGDFCLYKKSLKINKIKWLFFRMRFLIHTSPLYINYISSKFFPKFKLHFESKRYTSSPVSHLLILWGMDRMRTRYKQAIK